MVVKKLVMKKSHELTLGAVSGCAEAMDMFATVVLQVNKHYNLLSFINGEKREWKTITEEEINQIPREYKISKQEMAKLWGKQGNFLPDINTLDKRRKTTAKVLEVAARELMKPIRIKNPELYRLEDCPLSKDNDEEDWQIVNIIEKAAYTSNGLTITLTNSGIELITNESKGFAKIDLYLFFKLKGKCAKRLLEILTKTKSNIPYAISDLEKMLDSSMDSYKRPSSFLQSTIERPLKELIDVSEKHRKELGGAWIATTTKKGFTVKRSKSNRTSVKDIIYFDVKFVKDVIEIESKPPMTELESKALDAVTKLSEIVAKWRNGNRISNAEYFSIATSLPMLDEQNLLSTDAFAKLSKEFPPL